MGIVLNRQQRFDVRVVAFGPAPCLSPALAREANKFSLSFVNGFDIIPRFSMRSGQRAAAELVTTVYGASQVEGSSEPPISDSGSPNAGFAWVQWGADLMRQRKAKLPDASAMFVRNGTTELRLLRELMPLDYIDINARPDGIVTYAKKKGSALLEIQFSRRGMCSDHVIVAYRQRLEELDRQSIKAWAFRPRSRLRRIFWRPDFLASARSAGQQVEDELPLALPELDQPPSPSGI
jgi:hypothetical protein